MASPRPIANGQAFTTPLAGSLALSPKGEVRLRMAILRDLLSDWPGRLILAFLVAMVVVNIIVIWPER
jgi:hypothetical protein